MRNTLIITAALVAFAAWGGPTPREDTPTGTPAQISAAKAKIEEKKTAYQKAQTTTASAKAAWERAQLDELTAKGNLFSAQTDLFLLEETPAQRKAREERHRLEEERNPKPTTGSTKSG